MASYSNIGIKLITTGDESGTWGDSTNSNFSDVLDEAIAGAVTYNIGSDADFTLTVSDGTSSDARHAVIKFTSVALSATRVCTFAPNDLQKVWIVINSTTGGQSLTFKQGSAGSTVTVPNGESAIIYSDGAGASAGAISRVLDSFTNTKVTTATLAATNITSSNAIPVSSGGTGQSSYTDGQLLIGNSSGNTLNKANLTAGTGITITNGPGSISISTSAGVGDVSGPASSTDNAVARFDSTTGKIIQNSSVTIDDSGVVSAAGLTLSTALSAANGGTGLTSPGSSGNVLTSNGTGWTSSPVAGLPTMNIVTGTTQTASALNQYVLTNAAATTLTLPATPAAGAVVWVTVANGRTDNVIARNGEKINSIAENMTLNAAYAAVQLRYVNSTIGWAFS